MMGNSVGQAWINFFFFGANFISFLAALTGFIASWVFTFKVKDFLGRETRQHAKPSSVIAWFLVASIGLSFATFVQRSHEAFYVGTGAGFGASGNPISWRAEDAPNIMSISPDLMFVGVIMIGFTFLGAVAFYLALITMMRFDSMHPQHHGAIKDFFMYVFGGIVSTNIAAVFGFAAKFIPFLQSTAEMFEKAKGNIF